MSDKRDYGEPWYLDADGDLCNRNDEIILRAVFINQEQRLVDAVNLCAGVSNEALRALASRGGLAALLEAAQRLLADWDSGENKPRERWVADSEMLPEGYWSPSAAMVRSENVAALRALLPQTGEAGTDHANVRHLTPQEQETLHRALRRSVNVIAKGEPTPSAMSEGERGILSELEICNLALRRVGVPEISSLDENSSAARHCLELYAPRLDNLLRIGSWPYQPLLANALAWRLAADLASALKDDVTRRHEAMGEFSRALLANQEAGFAEKAIGDALSKREGSDA